jgi:hypothetical protein
MSLSWGDAMKEHQWKEALDAIFGTNAQMAGEPKPTPMFKSPFHALHALPPFVQGGGPIKTVGGKEIHMVAFDEIPDHSDDVVDMLFEAATTGQVSFPALARRAIRPLPIAEPELLFLFARFPGALAVVPRTDYRVCVHYVGRREVWLMQPRGDAVYFHLESRREERPCPS